MRSFTLGHVVMQIDMLRILTIVAGLLGAAAGDIENVEDYKPPNITVPFKPWLNKESPWVSSLASPHIVGGKEAVPHSHPHHVAVYIKGISESGNMKFVMCSGALLSESWIVTAAHCVDKRVIFQDMKAKSGNNKLIITAAIGVHNLKELYAAYVQMINASEIIIHPQWSLPIKNDIALLKLEKNVKLDEKYAKYIRLPKNSQMKESFAGSLATISGWGDIDKNTSTDKLHTANSKVLSNLYCKFRYLFFLVSNTNICVSGSKASTCFGDSGGPLIVKEADGQPTLIGITSFGFGCTWGFPPVFTRITSYLRWILDTTNVVPRTS